MGENGKFVMMNGTLVWVPDFSKQPINNDAAIDFIIKEEGFLKKPKDIGDGKITIGSGLTDPKWIELYKAKGNKWSDEDNRMAVAEEVQKRREWNEENVPNWERLSPSAQNALLSYRYNYNYTRDNSPKLFKALKNFNLFEAAKQMDATSGNSKFTKGLGDRREREQNLFLSDYNQEPPIFNTEPEVSVSTKVVTPYSTQLENTKRVPAGPYKDEYIVTESEKRRQQLRKAFKAKQDYNRIMEATNLQNTATPQFTSTSSLFAKGGLLEPKDAWDRLSIPEKADIIKVGIKHGIFDLQELRKKYNEFAEGGSKEEEEEVNTIIPYTQRTEVVITPDTEYNQYLNTLPDNQRFTPNDKYDSYFYWKLNGKPRNFEEAYAKGMFNFDHSDNGYHANSIAFDDNTGIGYFMKPKDHDTVGFELDWFNKGLVTEEGGKQRPVTPEEAVELNEFRKNYLLTEDPDRPNYYRYQPIKHSIRGPLVDAANHRDESIYGLGDF